MNAMTEAFVTIAAAIVGVALLAVFVSQKSNTAGVIQSFFSGFSGALNVAVSPVTGASISPDYSYPGNSFGASGFGSFR